MTINVAVSKRVVNIIFPRSMPANVEAWMDALIQYDSDESAKTAGLIVGDWYLTAGNHMSAPPGIPKKIIA